MDEKTILLMGAAGLMFLAISNKGKEKYFNVPGVGPVPESALPSMGYTKLGGQWFLSSAVNNAAIQAGGSPGQTIDEGTQIFNTIMAILQAGFTLYQKITQITQANKTEAVNQIWDKYTSSTSPDYMHGAFPHTKQELQNMTPAQLQIVLEYGYLN